MTGEKTKTSLKANKPVQTSIPLYRFAVPWHFCPLPWWGTCSAFVSLPDWHRFLLEHAIHRHAYVPIGHLPLGPAIVSEFQCLWCNRQNTYTRHTQKIHLYHWAVTDTSTAATFQSEDNYIALPSNKKPCKISLLGQQNGFTKGLQDWTWWGFSRIKALTIAKKRWHFFCLVINALGKKTFLCFHTGIEHV